MRALESRSGLLRRLWFALLLVTLLAAPWLGGQMEGVGPAVGRALAAATALVWLIDRPGRVEAPLPVALFWIFVAWCCVTVLVSQHLHGSLVTLGDYVSWGGLALVASDAGRDAKKRLGIGLTLLLSLAVVGGFGCYDGMTNVAGWRVFGPFATPNLYASYLITLLPLALFATLREPSDLLGDLGSGITSKAFAALCAVPFLLGLTALLMTGSKGAVLAFAVALFVVAVAARGWRRVHPLGVGLAAGLVVLAVLVGGKVLLGRVGSATTGEAHSGEFRRLTWEGTARMAAAHPVVGTGVGTFGANFSRYAVAGWTAAAHNAYLQTAAETGVPGVLLLVTALGTAAWSLRKQALSEKPQTSLLAVSMLAGLLAAAAHNIVDYGWAIWAPGAVMWALMGLGLSEARSRAWPRWAVWPAGLALIGALTTGGLTANARARAGAVQADSDVSPTQAAETYGAARRLDPLDAKLAVVEGRAWRAAGELDRAERSLREATRLNRGDAAAWRNLAEVLAASGRPQDAAQVYRDGLRYSPNGMKLLAGLARTEAAMGHTDSAIEQWRTLARVAEGPVGRYPAVPEIVEMEPLEAYVALARHASEVGDSSGARQWWSMVLEYAGRYERNRTAYPVQWEAVGRGDTEEAARVAAHRAEAFAALKS